MTPEKTKHVLRTYLHLLGDVSVKMPEEYYALKYKNIPDEVRGVLLERGHAAWMCQQALQFIDEGHTEKAMRWLGWVNGVMWRHSLLSLNEIRDMCRPDPVAPVPAHSGFVDDETAMPMYYTGIESIRKNHPEAYAALPETYKADHVLSFFVDVNGNLCASHDQGGEFIWDGKDWVQGE